MKSASWTDKDGRRWATMLPQDTPDTDASLGIAVGPPSLESLKLPLEIEVRLHNQLFDRKIFTARDARRAGKGLFAAWQAALKTDVQQLMGVYLITDQ